MNYYMCIDIFKIMIGCVDQISFNLLQFTSLSVCQKNVSAENAQSEETDIDDLCDILKKKKDSNRNSPTCISSVISFHP